MAVQIHPDGVLATLLTKKSRTTLSSVVQHAEMTLGPGRMAVLSRELLELAKDLELRAKAASGCDETNRHVAEDKAIFTYRNGSVSHSLIADELEQQFPPALAPELYAVVADPAKVREIFEPTQYSQFWAERTSAGCVALSVAL